MTSIDWKAWLAAANPLRPPADAAGLTRAARLASVSVLLSVVWSLIELIKMVRDPAGYAQTMVAAAPSDPNVSPEFFAAMFAAMMPLLIAVSFVFLVAWLVLAWVQWRQLTRVIPALLFLFSAWSLLMAAAHTVGGGDVASALGPGRIAAGAAVNLVCAVLYAVAWRGAARLRALAPL